MAWTGAATVKKVSDKCVRITGTLSLAGDASGTIGFAGETVPADVELPLLPDWQPRSDSSGVVISLADLIEITMQLTTDVTTPVPISITKAGTTQDDFKITVHNDSAADASGVLHFYIVFH